MRFGLWGADAIGSAWFGLEALRGIDQRRLRDAPCKSQYAVWLVRSRAYVPPQPDDGHIWVGIAPLAALPRIH
jgi:hypothetical protein